jgi:hypothetical protein
MFDLFDYLGLVSAPQEQLMDQLGDEGFLVFRKAVLDSMGCLELIKKCKSSGVIPHYIDFIQVIDNLIDREQIIKSQRFATCCILIDEWYTEVNLELDNASPDEMCSWIMEAEHLLA